MPWPAYLFAPAAIISMFMGRLFSELLAKIRSVSNTAILEFKGGKPAALGLFIALLAGVLILVFFPLQHAIRHYVLSRDDAPKRAADLLNSMFDADMVVETWERELGVLTDHQYHFPDQSYLIMAHAAKYRNASQDYLLGYDYFETIKPSVVVIGWYARYTEIYDPLFLAENSKLVGHIDEGFWSYEVYEVNYPVVIPKK